MKMSWPRSRLRFSLFVVPLFVAGSLGFASVTAVGPAEASSLSGAGAATAVGYFPPASGRGETTLADEYDGASWAPEKTPHPPNMSSPALQAVSCVNAQWCVAVGGYVNTTVDKPVTLADVFDGAAWRIQRTPNPKASTSAALWGVSCVRSNFCAAVGSFHDARSGRPVTLVETFNGTAWSFHKSPNPGSATASYLVSVSCISSQDCVAVGSYFVGNLSHQRTLIETPLCCRGFLRNGIQPTAAPG